MIKHLVFLLFLICTVFLEAQSNQEFQDIDNLYKASKFQNLDDALNHAKSSLAIAESLSNTELKVYALNNLSEIYLYRVNNFQALDLAKKGLELSYVLKNYKLQSIFLHRIGILEKRFENSNTAYVKYQDALQIALKHNFKKVHSEILISLSLLERENRNYKSAFKQIKQSLNIAKKNNFKNTMVKAYNVYGALYFKEQKDSAIYFYNRSLGLAKLVKNRYMQAIVLSNLGDIHLSQNNFKQAFKSLDASMSIAEEIRNNYSLFFTNISLGIYSEKIENYEQAEAYYKSALDKYGHYVTASKRLNAYWLLSGAFDHLGKYKEGFLLQEKYIFLNDSLFNINKIKEFEELKTQYEVEKKDNQIVLLQTTNELESTRKKWIVAASLLLLIPLSLIALFYRHRTRSLRIISKQEKALHEQERINLKNEQQLKASQALIKGQDEERHRISKELHDGLGGQLANVTLGLTTLNAKVENPEIDKINGQLVEVFKELRGVSHRLNTNYLSHKSFKQLLADLQNTFANSNFVIEISVFPEDCLKNIHVNIKHHLYRILQELLTNITKHSKASEVLLSITSHDDILSLIIEDNGKGFDLEVASEGVGLKNIKERIDSIDARLLIDSKIEKGTTVVIEIPKIIEL